MARVEVLLHLLGTVEVDAEQEQSVKVRIQEALEELTATLESFGVEYREANIYAKPTEEML